MTKAFNPPPNWPEPPETGWAPPPGWKPSAAWDQVPSGWRLWVDTDGSGDEDSPLLASEDVPAAGARIRRRIERYPVEVMNPGMWSQNHLDSEDYGFGAAPERRDRPRVRLTATIAATVVGFLLAAATVTLFVLLTDFAGSGSLHERLLESSGALSPVSATAQWPGTS